MVLSPDYLKSQFASPEWAVAFAQDPQGLKRKLVPVVVRPCQPDGLLAPIIQIRIVGLDEMAARARLLAGISQQRAKPSRRPAYPGGGAALPHKAFPGPAAQGALATTPAAFSERADRPNVLPPLNRPPTDLDKRRFILTGVEAIWQLFERNLVHSEQENDRIHTDFQARSATEFRAEIFVDGQRASTCRIWLGGMHSENNICYAEGRLMSDTACNEIINLADHGRSLGFQAMMNSVYFGTRPPFDTDSMSAEQMAGYLWGQFVAPLARQR